MIPKKITSAGFQAIVIALLCVVTYFFLEGVSSVYRGGKPSTSVTYRALGRLIGNATHDKSKEIIAYKDEMVLTDNNEIEDLLEKFKASRVGLGNTPYNELDVLDTSTTTVVDGCRRHKPNMRVAFTHLNSMMFNPFDPIVAFWHEDHDLDPEVVSFLSRYGVGTKVAMRTNRFGDRVTLPSVESEKKVIVAGDSVAIGLLLNDRETLASHLQAKDSDRNYINAAVAGASASEVICAIEYAVQNYGGSIDELIYVYCENDFDPEDPFGKPEQVIEWLKGFVAKHNVRKVTVIYGPYIYNVVPQLTRFKGVPGHNWPDLRDEKGRLAAGVKEAGFRFIDFTDIAVRENRERGTVFAAFGLFVDEVHLSQLGTRMLAEQLNAP